MKSGLLSFVVIAFLLFSNNSIAQSSKEDKKKEKQQLITSIVADSQHYVFVAQTASPQNGKLVNLSYGYDIVISKDSIKSYMPYYGRAYSGIEYGATTSPLEFLSTKFTYKTVTKKKGDGWDITIEIIDQPDSKKLMFSIYDNGSASLMVTTSNRSQISFSGDIVAVKPKKE